ncbi:MAG: hypothetical protein WKG07_00995 [Hymenobacter sp.]
MPVGRLHFLHPSPPAPQESKTSTRRDAELLVVGREIERHDGPHHRGRRPERRGLVAHLRAVPAAVAAARPAQWAGACCPPSTPTTSCCAGP